MAPWTFCQCRIAMCPTTFDTSHAPVAYLRKRRAFLSPLPQILTGRLFTPCGLSSYLTGLSCRPWGVSSLRCPPGVPCARLEVNLPRCSEGARELCEADMMVENVVLTAEVTHEGKLFTAPYFIEKGAIHANIEGRTMILPLGRIPPEVTVASILRAALERASRRSVSATSAL